VLTLEGLHVPVILLVELVGSAGALLFWHIGPIWVKVGVTSAVTIISIVTVVAPCPAVGVNVYVVVPAVAVLIVAGLHVPVILLVEDAGNADGVEFWHNGPICVNVGVTRLLIWITIVVVVAHWPAAGVKVYVVEPAVAVLMLAGLHVPVILLFELVGNAGGVEPWLNGPICVNVGVICAEITILMVAVVPHWPAAGVNVYVVVPTVAVLMVAGLQVPVTPFLDEVGRAGAVAFWHSGPIWSNVGVTPVEITIFMVVVVPHWPVAGVNV
jgi:hypothetical protein